MKTLLMKSMVNDLGVDPNEWFENSEKNDPIPVVITDEYAPCDVEYDLENPDESDEIESLKVNDDWFDTPHNEVEDSLHEKMYQMATKNGGSWVGGSENLGGGSEERLEEEFTPENDPYGGY